MRFQIKPLVSAASITGAILLAGCISSDLGGPTSEEVKQAGILAESGTNTLGNVDLSISALSYSQEDLDSLQAANDKFEAAYSTSKGTNNKAAFGSAITAVLLAENSPAVKPQLDNVANTSPLDPALVTNAPLARIALVSEIAAKKQDPEFHNIQDTIRQYFLPALDKAIARLNNVYADPNFSVTITVDGRVREIDHAEVGVMLAGFKAVHALITLFLAYDLDFDHNGSYDYLDTIGNGDLGSVSTMSKAEKDSLLILTQLLSPSSTFLSTSRGSVAGVTSEIIAAVDILKASVASIQNETDPQNDDLMHLCTKSTATPCISTADFDTALADMDTAHKYLTQPHGVIVADTTIQVNFAAFFSVQDYKKMMPYYGFYPESQWSDAQPVLYFTNGSSETGNLKTVNDIIDNYNNSLLTSAQTVTQLSAVIHFQDPTFQGFLPGATEAKIWSLVKKQMDWGSDPVLAKRGIKLKPSAFMRPDFALSLLRGAH